MTVAICIVSYRNAHDVAQCLAALEQSSDADFTVCICENGGPAAEAELARTIGPTLAGGQPIKRLYAPENPGFAGGVNRCITATPDADAWWVLNPDCIPDRDALSLMVARLEPGRPQGIGGTIHHPTGWVQAYGGGRWRPWLSRVRPFGFGAALSDPVDVPRLEREIDYLSGASFLINRAFVEAIGLMREDYFLYCEEIEYFERAKLAKPLLTLVPQSRVAHLQGTTTGSGGPMRHRGKLPIYLEQRNRLLLARDTPPRRVLAVAILLLLQYPLIYGRRLAFRQWGYALQGWLAGLRGERDKPAWMCP